MRLHQWCTIAVPLCVVNLAALLQRGAVDFLSKQLESFVFDFIGGSDVVRAAELFYDGMLIVFASALAGRVLVLSRSKTIIAEPFASEAETLRRIVRAMALVNSASDEQLRNLPRNRLRAAIQTLFEKLAASKSHTSQAKAFLARIAAPDALSMDDIGCNDSLLCVVPTAESLEQAQTQLRPFARKAPNKVHQGTRKALPPLKRLNALVAGVVCAWCALPAAKLCAGCRKLRYCTLDHQKADWKTHKRRCKFEKEKEKKLNNA